jgi:xylan 1,4-beta-xylosidase
MQRRNFIRNSALSTAPFFIPSYKLWNDLFSLPTSMVISPAWNKKGIPIKHTWKGLGNVDQMRWIIRKDMQDQLALCHKEIGLKHVRAIGIFDDELRAFGVDPANFLNKEQRKVKRTNWRIPFYIYDSLIDMGINPMVTTCFTPSGKASGDRTTFETKSNITPPKDMEDWKLWLKDFTQSLADRYGKQAVRQWYFEVWNEPNLSGFWTGGKEKYFELYRLTYDTIKNIDPSFKVGGPSTASAEWIGDLLEYGSKNNCLPDYIIGHIYNNDSASKPLSPFEGPQGDKENKSANYSNGVMRGVRKLLDEANYKGEVHWNEWGLSWHPFAPVRETANEAAFIIKTMNAVSQVADYFAYWCLSDIYDQIGYGREAFHGNYGMLSLDGLRKPSYHAHQLLGKLGTEQIVTEGQNLSEQSNAFVTRNQQGVQAIVYAFDINYQATDAPGTCNVELYLPDGVDPKSASLYLIDSKENNIVNNWKEIGSPAYLSRTEKKHLHDQNHLTPSSKLVKFERDANGLKAKFKIETPSVAMLSLKNK